MYLIRRLPVVKILLYTCTFKQFRPSKEGSFEGAELFENVKRKFNNNITKSFDVCSGYHSPRGGNECKYGKGLCGQNAPNPCELH